jgi:hypothetical protein
MITNHANSIDVEDLHSTFPYDHYRYSIVEKIGQQATLNYELLDPIDNHAHESIPNNM